MNKIKNIIFDLGGVILNGRPISVLDKIDISNDVKDKLKKTYFSNWDDLDLGNISLEDQFNKYNLDEVVDDKLKEYLLQFYLDRDFNEEVLNLIKKLKEMDYNIYILSDNLKEVKEYLITLPFFKDIDGYVISCDYGVTKSNPEIFKILINKYSLNTDECYFIDDKEENISTANKFGIKGYVLDIEKDGIDNLIKDMKDNYIL